MRRSRPVWAPNWACSRPAVKIIQVKVKPNARASKLEVLSDGTWLARIKALPIDGKANDELVGLIAKRFAVAKASVSIRSGAGGRSKLVRIDE